MSYITDIGIQCSIANNTEDFIKNLRLGKSGEITSNTICPEIHLKLPTLCTSQEKLNKELVLEQIKKDAKNILSQIFTRKKINIDFVLLGSCDEVGEWLDTDFNFKEIYTQILNYEFGIQVEEEKFINIHSSCSTGNNLLIQAHKLIENNYAENVLVIAHEAPMFPEYLMQLASIGAMNENNFIAGKASRPFSKNRSGFVKGDGSACMILAKTKSDEFYAIYSGGFQNNDANEIMRSQKDGFYMNQCIEESLLEAKINYPQLDFISAHGTSTSVNDEIEAKLIEKLNRKHQSYPFVNALKSQIGHTNIACGLIEAAACALMLKHNFIAPTINIDSKEVEFDIIINTNIVYKELSYCLSLSFGFGGVNSSIVLAKE
ncbi:MAG: beta-ketoacyl synthase [Bdellovibrionales bacterium]|nr:beta-ketoacyl synthase [Bdellovibrionales bacterium]